MSVDPGKRAALEALEAKAREVASALGLEVVEFAFHSRGRHSQLRIDIDRAGAEGVGLSDCEALSRALDEALEALFPVDVPYELQVSSPGIDRPIRTADDFRRNAGRSVRAILRDDSGREHEVTGILRLQPGGAGAVVETDAGSVPLDPARIVLIKQEVTSGGGKRSRR